MSYSPITKITAIAVIAVIILITMQFPAFSEDAVETPTATEQIGEVTGPVTLADVMTLTLQRSPELAAFAWDIRASEARQIQARLRPNPELLVEIEDVRLGGGPDIRTRQHSLGLSSSGVSSQLEYGSESGAKSGFPEAQFTVSLSQLIELGGKRAKRMQLAASDRDVSAWDYEVARADVLKNAAQTFVSVLAAQERVVLDGELVQTAEQVLNTVSARVNAGRVSPLEAIKAQTALSTVQIQANASIQTLEATRSALAASWGENEARFERAEGRLDEVRAIPALDELRARIDKNPDLSRWQAEIEKRLSVIAVEKSKAKPDITIGAGFRTRGIPESGVRTFGYGSEGLSFSQDNSRADRRWENMMVLEMSVPLPLFNRNQGAILEAENLASKANEQRRAMDVQVHVNLSKGYQDLFTAYSTLSTLKESILPAATQTFESVNQAYKEGMFGYLDVLDAQRTLFEARQQYLDALVAYHEGVAEIERTIGESLWDKEDPTPHSEEER